jgi:hypothetical protein
MKIDLFENLTETQGVNKFSIFDDNPAYITMQTTSKHSIKSTPILIHCFFKINLYEYIIFLHTILTLPSSYLYSHPLTKLLCVLLISPEPATYLFFETPTILTEQCQLQNSSLCVSILMLFHSLRIRNTPQYSILRNHQSTFIPYGKRLIFIPSQNDSYQMPFASSQMEKHAFWLGVTYIYIYIYIYIYTQWWRGVHFCPHIYSAPKRITGSKREKTTERAEIWSHVITQEIRFQLYPLITFNFFESYSLLKSRWTMCIRRITEMKIIERKCVGLTETPKGQDIVLINLQTY